MNVFGQQVKVMDPATGEKVSKPRTVFRITRGDFNGGSKKNRKQIVVSLEDGDVIGLRFARQPARFARKITVNDLMWHLIRTDRNRTLLEKARIAKQKKQERLERARISRADRKMRLEARANRNQG
jgi:hypothetical protein